jgi:hypothetical protein
LDGVDLLGGLTTEHEEIRRVSLNVFVTVDLLAIPAYRTAESTEQGIEHLTGVSEASIEEHEVANLAFAVVVVLGVAG